MSELWSGHPRRRFIYVVWNDEMQFTVIADSEDSAVAIARRQSDDEDSVFQVREDMEEDRRWVTFESEGDRDAALVELDQSGANLREVRVRDERTGLGEVLWWSVGATDVDWCRTAPGVLCGGES